MNSLTFGPLRKDLGWAHSSRSPTTRDQNWTAILHYGGSHFLHVEQCGTESCSLQQRPGVRFPDGCLLLMTYHPQGPSGLRCPSSAENVQLRRRSCHGGTAGLILSSTTIVSRRRNGVRPVINKNYPPFVLTLAPGLSRVCTPHSGESTSAVCSSMDIMEACEGLR